MPTLQVTPDCNMYYEVTDFAEPWREHETILLLHGNAESGEAFYGWMPELTRDYRVVRPDMRGFGRSTPMPRDHAWSLDRIVDDFIAVMDHLKIDAAHFIGVSGGGYLAQQIAIHHPARALSALLFASRPGFKDSKGAAWIPEMERVGLRAFIAETLEERLPIHELDQAQIDWFLDEIARNDEGLVKRFVLYMTTQYWMDDVARIQCPTLLVAPAGDAIGNASAYADMKQRIKDSELVTYDVANHNICDYLADRCAADARDFLRRKFGI